MKNILSYYYGIIPEKIDNNGYFSYDNHLFCLSLYKRSINEIDSLYLLNNYMLSKKIYINNIVVNKYNQVLTLYENKYYVLLIINYEYNKGYFNFYLAPTNKEFKILERNNWAYLWGIKVDYVEYQIKHLKNKYPLLMNSVNYHIGLTENAISYFKMLNLENIPLYINHRRIKKSDLYNPIELIIDYKVRDIAEYLKYCFFHNEKDTYDIKKFLNGINLNNIDYLLLYIRMLYPSYYFDIYDNIINNDLDENIINNIINRVNDYEELLYDIYMLIRRRMNILGIEWINNKYRSN